jgi:hypothetical protein
MLCPAAGPPIRMTLDELDIGNRSLNMLLAFYEHKYKAQFLRTQKVKLARGVYNAVGPLMLTIRDPGGFALEDVPKEIFPEALVSVRADDSEVELTHSSDPGDLRKESRKEAQRIEREARRAQLDNKDASFNEIAAVTKKELADDKAAEERRLRAELGMVRPADTDPDLKCDRMTSSTTADMVGS